ncbi:MAG: hypothetical protein AB1768_14680 [Pseudomonadota bacterium]|jgi:hypothetical protein
MMTGIDSAFLEAVLAQAASAHSLIHEALALPRARLDDPESEVRRVMWERLARDDFPDEP